MLTQNRRFMVIVGSVIVLLSLPLIAMQFDTGVDWDIRDFIIMGILLLTTGLGCELVLRKVTKPLHRLAICGIILFVFFLIWAELAVGLFGTPFAGS